MDIEDLPISPCSYLFFIIKEIFYITGLPKKSGFAIGQVDDPVLL